MEFVKGYYGILVDIGYNRDVWGDNMKIGDMLIVVGTILIVLGLVWKFFPILGKLPGDIVIKGDGYSIYIPIVSSILVSVILTILLNIIVKVLGGWR